MSGDSAIEIKSNYILCQTQQQKIVEGNYVENAQQVINLSVKKIAFKSLSSSLFSSHARE